jgi:hypothetical protein
MTKLFYTYVKIGNNVQISIDEDAMNKIKNNKGATNNESCFQKSKSKLRGCRGY